MSAPEIVAAKGGREARLALVKGWARDRAHGLSRPLVHGLARIGVSANHLTILGCLASLAAAGAFFVGRFQLAAGFIAFSGLCDLLDGELAREGGRVSLFGAFLDSTLDRFGEGAILIGIAGFYVMSLAERAAFPGLVRAVQPATWALVALTAMVALVGSLLVSYTRARAEGLGLECKVGWFERPERIVLLILAGAFGVGPVMPWVLWLLAVLSFVTAAQRVAYVWKTTRSR